MIHEEQNKWDSCLLWLQQGYHGVILAIQTNNAKAINCSQQKHWVQLLAYQIFQSVTNPAIQGHGKSSKWRACNQVRIPAVLLLSRHHTRLGITVWHPPDNTLVSKSIWQHKTTELDNTSSSSYCLLTHLKVIKKCRGKSIQYMQPVSEQSGSVLEQVQFLNDNSCAPKVHSAFLDHYLSACTWKAWLNHIPAVKVWYHRAAHARHAFMPQLVGCKKFSHGGDPSKLVIVRKFVCQTLSLSAILIFVSKLCWHYVGSMFADSKFDFWNQIASAMLFRQQHFQKHSSRETYGSFHFPPSINSERSLSFFWADSNGSSRFRSYHIFMRLLPDDSRLLVPDTLSTSTQNCSS